MSQPLNGQLGSSLTTSKDTNATTPSTLELVQALTAHDDRVWSLAWHPTRPILASSSTDKQLRLYQYRLKSNQLNNELNPKIEFQYIDSIPSAHTRTVRSIDWSPKRSLLASGSFDSTASIWSTNSEQRDNLNLNEEINEKIEMKSIIIDEEINKEENWECIMSLEGHESEVKGVSWNRNGSLLATCSRDKSVWIWEILIGNRSNELDEIMNDDEGYEVVSVLMDHEADVKSICWSPIEDLLCSTSYDNNIHLYAEDVSSDGDFTLIHRLQAHQSTVWDASFSPCGEFLASCSDDLSIRIWHREKIPKGGVEGRDGGLIGGWRIGRSERERWTCVNAISGYHFRTIYSIDWTFFQSTFEEKEKDEEQSLGLIASCGGDGMINIFKISKGVSVSGLDISSAQPNVIHLAQRKRGHGDSDINDVAWCKIKSFTQFNHSDHVHLAHSMLASAGDDGSVKIWKIAEEIQSLE